MGTVVNAGPTPNPIPNDGIIVDSTGKLTESGWWLIQSLRTGTTTALDATNLSAVTLVPVGGVVTPDLALSGVFGTFVLEATALAVTIETPVFTKGTVPPGATLTFYYDQDAVGGRPGPIWGAGFAAEMNTISIVEEAMTRTAWVVGFDGISWTLKSFQTGLSV